MSVDCDIDDWKNFEGKRDKSTRHERENKRQQTPQKVFIEAKKTPNAKVTPITTWILNYL